MSSALKVLVTEDEAEMRRNLLTVLRLDKFHGVVAENGRVGVDWAKQAKPDIVLCDVMMPEFDGYGFSAPPKASRAVRSGMNLGADDYLTKPLFPTSTGSRAYIKASCSRSPAVGRAGQGQPGIASIPSSANPP